MIYPLYRYIMFFASGKKEKSRFQQPSSMGLRREAFYSVRRIPVYIRAAMQLNTQAILHRFLHGPAISLVFAAFHLLILQN